MSFVPSAEDAIEVHERELSRGVHVSPQSDDV